MALGGVTAPTQSSRPPPGYPAATSAASTPGRHDVHGMPGQPVVVAQPPPGPLARGHDRGRRRQRRDLARLVPRHVHEDDEPQPAGLRHQHLRHHRGDQAVDEHQGAVGHLRPAPQPRAARGRPRRARPPAGHGVLVDRPAERGEPAAGPAVVDVAAARPPRVVDPVGDHDVHRRSQRPLVARPRDVRLVQGHRDPGQPLRGVAERAGVRPGRRAGRRSACASTSVVVLRAGEVGLVVEVAVGERPPGRRAAPRWPGRCRRRCRRRRASARRKVASTTYVAPCSRCAGPNTSPRKLWAIIMWSRTVTLNIGPTPAS